MNYPAGTDTPHCLRENHLPNLLPNLQPAVSMFRHLMMALFDVKIGIDLVTLQRPLRILQENYT